MQTNTNQTETRNDSQASGYQNGYQPTADQPEGYTPAEPSPPYYQSEPPQPQPQQYEYQPQQPQQQEYQYRPPLQQQYQYQPPFVPLSPGDVGPFEMTSMGMKARTAGLLCYLFGWVGGLVFLFLEKNSPFVRFHAIQSIIFFGGLSILGTLVSFIPFLSIALGGMIGLVTFIGWILLMIAAHRGRYYKIPLIGDYAENFARSLKL